MISMHIKSLGANAIENRYSENQDKIRNILYHGEKFRWGINRYVLDLEHKNCHEERYQLVMHGHHDFTERKKFYYLLRGIKVPNPEATITMIESSDDHRENCEFAQLLLTGAVRRTTARKSTRTISMTATGRGRRGNGGRGGGRDRHGRNGGRPPHAPRHGRDPPPMVAITTRTLLKTVMVAMICRAS